MIPQTAIDQDFFSLSGGLDLVSPNLEKDPGTLFDALNYEPAISGGYSRVAGYEVFDGRTRPSQVKAVAIPCTLTTVVPAGTALTIGAATAVFVKAVDGGALLANVVGTIAGGTPILAGASNIGAVSVVAGLGYGVTPAIDAQWSVDAADYYRSLIGPVPGSGPVRGVWLFNGNVYAFRDNVGATAGVMHIASASGWLPVPFMEEISFTNASVNVVEGSTLTKGGVTATIRRIVLQSGSLASGTNTGRFIISSSSGSFTAGAATTTGSPAGAVTLSGAQTAITLPPGGRYRFRNFNFGQDETTECMYGVNGVGRAFEFDGTVFVPISTGEANDKPSHLEVNRNYLFLGLGTRVLFCVINEPTLFDAIQGAGEFYIGADLTGMAAMPGEYLGIFTRKFSVAIVGTVKSDFRLVNLAPKAGAISGVVGVMTDTYALDGRGIASMAASQSYGSFSYSTVSRLIQPLINRIKAKAIEAVVISTKDQMRIVCSDGFVLVMRPRGSKPAEFLPLQYGMLPYCCSVERDEDGSERVFIGAEDGYVYETDVGSTFNGGEIEAYIKASYFNARSPRIRKHFRFAVLEMTSTLYTSFKFFADCNYGNAESSAVYRDNVEVYGAGGVWLVSNWEEFYWDSDTVAQPKLRIESSGTNVSMAFYSKTKLDAGHTLQGATVHFTKRRLQR